MPKTKSYSDLPNGYKESIKINLQKDKKSMLTVNAVAILIAIIMIVPMLFYIPLAFTFDYKNQLIISLIKLGVLIVSIVAYVILHELTHGLAMRICGTKKIQFGIKGLYAYAKSQDFYYKRSYIFIALCPLIFWGIILAVVNIFIPKSWFWVIYLISVFNLSSSSGDLFVSLRFLPLSSQALIQDDGVKMTVYLKEEDDK